MNENTRKIYSILKNSNGECVVMSIHQDKLQMLLSGEKTLEVRKTFPKMYRGGTDVTTEQVKPFVVFFYETINEGGSGRIRAVGICDSRVVLTLENDFKDWDSKNPGKLPKTISQKAVDFCKASKFSMEEIWAYARTKQYVFGWHFSNIIPMDQPVEKLGIEGNPQAWMKVRLR